MRASIIFFLSALSIAVTVVSSAQQTGTEPAPTAWTISHRERNERTWQRTIYTASPSGQVIPQVQTYKELGTSLCYVGPDGAWTDSQDNITILPDGSGCSTDSCHQVYWPADIANGTIQLVHDGIALSSQPIGLSYDNGTNTVLLAALTNSVGELISTNEILYPNAFFGGGIQADLLYINRRGGFEQDVIIRSQLPAPEQFSLNSSDTRLQLLTEFFNPPVPVQSIGPVNPQDGLQDTALSFGSMALVPGRAFLIGDTNSQDLLNRVNVYKAWTEVAGRTLLIEQLPYERISARLAGLPANTSSTVSSANSILLKVSSRRLLPPVRLPRPTRKSIQLAENDFRQKPGFVCDYATIDSAETNFTFCADETYCINSSDSGYYLYGTTTIEGDSVIKMPNDAISDGLLIIAQNGTVNCQTAPYRPAVFTSINDNSVGSPISGSTGNPIFNNNYWALEIDATNVSLHDLRFCYAWWAVAAEEANTNINLTNCQFINGDNAIYADNANLYNVLIGRSTNEDPAIWTVGPNLVCENVTADGGNSFIEADYAGAIISLTNCLITGQPLITNSITPTLATNEVAWVPSPSVPVYETAGGAAYYLATNSPYRGRGTANIDPGLLAELQSKTTYPPVVYEATNVSSLRTLAPIVSRDTNSSPDIGYHYDCLDYVLGGCDLHSNLTVTAGTAVGWFEENNGADPYGQPYGISLNGGANLSLNGNATQPCIFARYAMVQEAENGNWNGSGYMGAIMFNGGSPEPQLSADFTKVISAGLNENFFRDAWASGAASFRNCEFYNQYISTYDMTSLNFTNCLFFRICQTFNDSLNLAFENCTLYNGSMDMVRSSPVTWLIENCAFDGTAFKWNDVYDGTSYTTINYNAYNTNNLSWKTYPISPPYSGTNEVVGPNDLLTTNFNWESSWFGDFYLPTNSPVLHMGSTNANFLGLYHFTVVTNQAVEGTNIVSIGYHYVATDTNGVPLDSNLDGIPDYIEDPLGNGLPYDGTNWALAILVQPTNQTVIVGTNAALSVTAGGVGTLSYQWYFDSNLLAAATSATLDLPDAQTNDDGYYFVVVTNAFGVITSSVASLTVVVPANITAEPADLTVDLTSNATFSVTVNPAATTPVGYQWLWNGSVIPGATSSSFTITDVQITNVGYYSVIVTNAAGTSTSTQAALTATLFDAASFTNSSGLRVNGNANFTNTEDGYVLELTPSLQTQAGSAFLLVPLSLVSNASFSTYFSFRLSKSGGEANDIADGASLDYSDNHQGADGVVFCAQTLTNNVGSSGGGLGFWDITNSVGVVFDTWYNDGDPTWDPQLANSQTVLITENTNGTTGDGNHVGVVYNGYITNAATFSYGITSNGLNAVGQHVMDDMNNGNIWYAWIDYNGASSNLEIRLSETNSRPTAPTLTNRVNLVDFIGKTNAYLGFTGGTGYSYNQQDILTWQFISPYHPIGATTNEPLSAVQIISPVSQFILSRTNATIVATNTAAGTGVPLSWVEFFDNGEPAGYSVSSNASYEVPWIPITNGDHVLTALATDTNGLSLWSAPVTNYVRGLPTIAITNPVYGELFQNPPTNIEFYATAEATNDLNATVSSVIFFLGTNSIWTNSTPPYTNSWTFTNGTYTLSAEVIDSLGAVGITSNILITVEPTNRAPNVYAGPNQTNTWSTNGVQLNGIVSDDGLPLGSVLDINWTNLSGNIVNFDNSNLPVTRAYFAGPGTNVLQLSASDGQFTNYSEVTIVELPTNPPPWVFPGTNETVVLPAPNTNSLLVVTPVQVTESTIPTPIGIDYFPASNCVVVSDNYKLNQGGVPCNFVLVDSNGQTNQFSSLSNLNDEVYIAGVRNALGGFNVGEMFTGNGSNGEVMRIEADGSTIGTNVWIDWAGYSHSNAWLILPTIYSNGVAVVTPGVLRGGLWVDQTGVWGGDLIVSTLDGGVQSDDTRRGYIWRINSYGQARLVATIDLGPGAGRVDTFEGITTVPDDVQRYGPWAGRILVGGDFKGDLFAVDTNGIVVPFSFPFGAEDIRVIPQNENLFGCDESDGLVFGVPANQFAGMVGDVLIADEFDNNYLYRVRWNGTNFDTYTLYDNSGLKLSDIEGINFAPAALPGVPAPGWVQLNGVVTDSVPTIDSWTVISNSSGAQVEFSDSSLTNSTVDFTAPGTYVLQLSASAGEATVSSNVTIVVIQNQAPWVFAGTNQYTGTAQVDLAGLVTNIDLPPPYNTNHLVWTVASEPLGATATFGWTNYSTNATYIVVTNTVSLTAIGQYVLCLTADDGQATNSQEVIIDYSSDGNLGLSPAVAITASNELCTLTATLTDTNGNPITSTEVDFSVLPSNPDGTINSLNYSSYSVLFGNPPPGTFTNVTLANGTVSFTYTNLAALAGADIVEVTCPAYPGLYAIATNYWVYNLSCGDAWFDQTPGAGVPFLSIEPWADGNHSADYYVLQGVAGDTLQLGLNDESVSDTDPFLLFVLNSSNQIVAVSPPTQSGYDAVPGNNFSTLQYILPATTNYVIEVTTVNSASSDSVSPDAYDLYLSCSFDTNAPEMQISYGGTNVLNNGGIEFPTTSQGTATNIELMITNSGNLPFTITNAVSFGDFALTNSVLNDVLAPGASTNLGVKFNATATGLSFGSVILSANYPSASNYTVYLEASASLTNAGPTVQLISPPNGSVFLADYNPITLTAAVTAGSAPITSVYAWQLATNGINYGFNWTQQLYPINNYFTWSYNTAGLDGTPIYYPDITLTAIAQDAAGLSNAAPPVLIHILPYYSSDPLQWPQIQLLYSGTDVPCGGTIVFPQTEQGVATNVSLVITNAGNYPLGFTCFGIEGDFTTTNNLVGPAIPGGGSTNLEITFNASASGTSYGALILSNNASVGEIFAVELEAGAYSATYAAPSTNLPVATNEQFTVLANSANNILYPLYFDQQFDTNVLTITSVDTSTTAGTVTIINNGTAVSYTPPPGYRSEEIDGALFPADGFYYTISDVNGNTATGSVGIVIYATDGPEVALSVSPASVEAGNAETFMATVTNTPSTNIVDVAFYVNNQEVGVVPGSEAIGGTNYVWDWPALYEPQYQNETLIAAATDIFGQVGLSQPINLDVQVPPGATPPVASLDSYMGLKDPNGMQILTTNNMIRDGVFNVYGRAFDPGESIVWQLSLYSADGATLIRNLTPTNNVAEGSLTSSNLLAMCDLSTLQNGPYQLVLTAIGDYIETNVSVPFILDSDLKVGQFSFSQQDLVVPLNGIPLTVNRTYNSIDPVKGDFGYGWTYTLDNLNVSLDETRENRTDLDGNTYSEREGGGRDVTLTLPNGQTTTFAYYWDQNGSGGDSYSYYPHWQSAPGITYTLTAMGNPYYETLNGGWNDVSGQDDANFDFQGFYLTAEDGTVYTLSRPDLGDHFMLVGNSSEDGMDVQAYGTPYLSQINTLSNLETITISPGSIAYSTNGTPIKQILFQRNGDNLITAISDPNGLDSGGNPTGPPALMYQYDNQDNLISVAQLVNSNTVAYVTNTFSYTNSAFPHYITGIINANGTQVAKNFYDDSGKLIAVQDANGNLTQFFNTVSNSMEVVVDAMGNTNSYVYDSRGNVVLETNAVGQVTTMAYDVNNNKTNDILYLNGAPYSTNSYFYDTNLNVLLSSTDPLGNTTTNAYDGYGHLIITTDPRGNSTVNTYDGAGNLIMTVDALGDTNQNIYSGNLLVASVDPVGTMTTNTYDSYENLIASATLDTSGNILSSNTYTYDANNNRLSSTVWRQVSGAWEGDTTSNFYDSMNRVIETINPDGGTTFTVYNSTGQQQATTDADTNTTTYGYDNENRLIATTNADGTVTRSGYDNDGNRITSTDQEGRVTQYQYDGLNRLINTIYPDYTTNGTIYDALGRVAETIDGRGAITANSYDVAGRKIAVTNAFGTSVEAVSSYTFDQNGNQVTSTDADGHSTTNVYDVLNRQVQVEYQNGTTSETVYDRDGRSVAETNQDGIATLFGYDGAGRLIAVTNALGQVTQYQYDEAGNEVAQIDALGRANTFVYDSMGRKTSHTLPRNPSFGLQTEYFYYDPNGNETGYESYSGGQMLNSTYDSMNRLTARSDSYLQQGFTYTQTGQRLSSMNSSKNFTTWTTNYYDSRDRLAQKAVSWEDPDSGQVSATALLSYSYNANGNVTNIASGYANGVNLTYAYDPLNRLTNVLSHGQLAAAYAYDLAGNLVGMQYGNGVTNRYQYDSLNRLTNLVWGTQSSSLASFGYRLMNGGTRTNLVESINGGSPISYEWSFDNLYRLTNENIGTFGNVAYAYDSVGNRLNRNSTAYSYDTNDEMLLAAGGNTISNSYDVNGNTVGMATIGVVTNSYTYSSGLNQIVTASVNGNNTTQIGYDGDGNRVFKDSRSPDGSLDTLTFYLVDDRNPSGYPQVLEEYQGVWTNTYPNGWGPAVTLCRAYNYGLALISQQQFDTNTLLPSAISYYGFDGHGNVRFLMNASGGITDTYTYDAFGNLIETNCSTANNYLYCGQQWDPDLGLYYNRARYLNTDVGRFWTMDTFAGNNEDPLSLHKYLYAEGDPVNGTDPEGHYVSITSSDGITYIIQDTTTDFAATLQQQVNEGNKVLDITIAGHGTPSLITLDADQNQLLTDNGKRVILTDGTTDEIQDITDLLEKSLAANATIHLNACNTAEGNDNLAQELSWQFPGVKVSGYTTDVYDLGLWDILEGINAGFVISPFSQVTYINGQKQ